MNLLTVNAFLKEVTGDVHALPRAGAWAQIILVKGGLRAVFSEDQQVMFYIYLSIKWLIWHLLICSLGCVGGSECTIKFLAARLCQ